MNFRAVWESRLGWPGRPAKPRRDHGPPKLSQQLPSGSTLCEKCQALFDGRYQLTYMARSLDLSSFAGHLGHHISIPALCQAAQHGCGLCAQFISRLTNEEREMAEEEEGTRSVLYFEVNPPKTIPHIHLELRLVPPTSANKLAKVFHVDLWIIPSATLSAPSSDRPGNTQNALPQCKKWLEICMESHEACRFTSSSWNTNQPNPTRLVDISNARPRLFVPDQTSARIPYASLSHCWGKTEFTTLLKANLKSFRKQIPRSALTKTFRDAISIAKYLGFKYIWIDSLCIVQDDRLDWEREAGLMRRVYAAADINIAATSAKDGTEGCFRDRSSSWRCQIVSRLGNENTIWEATHEKSFSTQTSCLQKRGWVEQERYLSRRILHFHDNQVFWECLEKGACEVFSDGYPTERPASTPLRQFTPFAICKQPVTLERWREIVCRYTFCELTRISDKLTALAGLAEYVQSQTGAHYVAGMWREDLEWSLFWGSGPIDRYSPPMAPSWSWASTHGPILLCDTAWSDTGKREFFEAGSALFIAVHKLDANHPVGNPFLGPQTARLTLRCRFLFCGVLVHEYKLSADLQIANLYDETDTPLVTNLVSFLDTPDLRQQGELRCYLLPLMFQAADRELRCLVLQRVDSEPGLCFQRIGSCRTWDMRKAETERYKVSISSTVDSNPPGGSDAENSSEFLIDLI